MAEESASCFSTGKWFPRGLCTSQHLQRPPSLGSSSRPGGGLGCQAQPVALGEVTAVGEQRWSRVSLRLRSLHHSLRCFSFSAASDNPGFSFHRVFISGVYFFETISTP